MKDFSIKEAIKYGWETFKAEKKLLALAAFVFLLASNLHGFVDSDDLSTPLVLLLEIAFAVVSIIITIGWYKFIFKIIDGGKPHIKEMFSHKALFWKYLGTVLLLGLYMAVPLIISTVGTFGTFLADLEWLAALMVVVGLAGWAYVAVKYLFASLIIIDREGSIKDAFKESSRMTEGVKWKLLELGIMVLLINLLGVAALIVGVLVSVPVSTLAVLHVYRHLSWQKEALPENQKTP